MAVQAGLPRNLSVAQPASTAQSRILGVDALRGMALVLMALTHAAFFIGVGFQAESYGGQRVFLQGPAYWITGLLVTLASPIFWFLSGVSLALYESGQRRRQASEWAITRFMLIRGVVVLVLDLTICAAFWMGARPYVHVLTTMAVGMLILSVIRLLPGRILLIGTLALLLGYQWWLGTVAPELAANAPQSLWQAFWLTYSYDVNPAILFPVLGWAPLMWLGFLLGRQMHQPVLQTARTWLLIAGGLLALWLALRLNGGYGDLGAFQAGDPLPMFLVMSKAPPSLSYFAFKLAIAALAMALFVGMPQLLSSSLLNWMAAIGQASFFFYVMHILVYHFIAQGFLLLPLPVIPGVIYGYAVWLIGMAVLVPLALRYRTLRRKYPILRYF